MGFDNITRRPVDMTPRERMAEIRRLTQAAARAAVEAGEMYSGIDQMQPDDPAMWAQLDRVDVLWKEHDQLVTDLLECLERAEEAGDLKFCEVVLG